MNAHVDEGAKVHDVAHGARELHAGLQVVNRERSAAEDDLGRIVARVAPRLLELGHDVDEGEHTAAELAREHAHATHAPLDVRDAAARELVRAHARALEQRRGHGVALRVHGGGIKRVLAARDAQEAGCVLERLGAELRDLLELSAVGEGTMLLSIGHDVSGHSGRDAGDIAQKARAGGVHVHAHAVDHVFHHVAQRARKLRLVEVVLILSHANGLGRNLHELCERVLQAPPQAHGPTRGDVEVRVLLARELGC